MAGIVPNKGNTRSTRPDMAVCRTCSHFKDRPRTEGVARPRWMFLGRPPSNWAKECRWFQSKEGRQASPTERLRVMQAGANGGRDCPEVSS